MTWEPNDNGLLIGGILFWTVTLIAILAILLMD